MQEGNKRFVLALGTCRRHWTKRNASDHFRFGPQEPPCPSTGLRSVRWCRPGEVEVTPGYKLGGLFMTDLGLVV